MELTESHLKVASYAWAAAQAGGGVVLENESLVPAAHELSEAGWLERRSEANGDVSWFWTPEADAALNLSRLADVTGREN